MSDDQAAPKRTPEERKALIQAKAKQLAANQGLDWAGLTKEQRQALRAQVQTNMRARRAARTKE
jgi:hypothetical protein